MQKKYELHYIFITISPVPTVRYFLPRVGLFPAGLPGARSTARTPHGFTKPLPCFTFLRPAASDRSIYGAALYEETFLALIHAIKSPVLKIPAIIEETKSEDKSNAFILL